MPVSAVSPTPADLAATHGSEDSLVWLVEYCDEQDLCHVTLLQATLVRVVPTPHASLVRHR